MKTQNSPATFLKSLVTLLPLTLSVAAHAAEFESVPALAPVAPIKQECGSTKVPVEFSYCIYTSEGSNNPDVMYFLHGMGGDEKSWASSSGDIYQTWANKNYAPPMVISFSLGGFWLLSSKNNKPASGLIDTTLNQIMPWLEAKIGGIRGRRLLAGASMGGFNGAQLLLKSPKLFAKVALICPAFVRLNPYSSDGDVWDYVFRTGANAFLAFLIRGRAQNYYPDIASWNMDSPLVLAPTNLGPQSPPTYLSCGRGDDFGFFEGVTDFVAIAQARKAPLSWHPVDGGHCSFDPKAAAEFIIP